MRNENEYIAVELQPKNVIFCDGLTSLILCLYASFDVSICVHCRRPRSLLAHCHHAPAPQQRVNFGVEGRESDLQVGTKVW